MMMIKYSKKNIYFVLKINAKAYLDSDLLVVCMLSDVVGRDDRKLRHILRVYVAFR